jgi:sterol desaturase/sphingolipid hydroxylase (fatty acid hydroxylase superfamily)
VSIVKFFKIPKQTKSIILLGMVGCFLTSVTGISAVMIFKGWAAQGGWPEWLLRVTVGYSAALTVVVGFFPFIVPKLTVYFEKKLSDH